MRSFQIEGGFGIERLALVDAPSSALAPNEVRVRVRAISLNYRDLMVVLGSYDPRLMLPHTPGSDAAGEIVEIGRDVRGLEVGARVCTLFAPEWIAGAPSTELLRAARGVGLPGVFASELVLPAHHVVPAPSHLSFEEAATLPCAAVTAWHALVDKGSLRAGQTVLVQGSGGVSVFALQLARMFSATVIATSRSPEKRERLRALGAQEVIDYASEPEWGKRVRALTGGRGVDHVVEVGGAGTMAQSLRAVATGGYVHVIGVLSGGAPSPFSVLPVLMNEVTLSGVMVGPRAAALALHRALEAAQVRPVIDQTFPFEALPDALRHMQAGAHFGKIVLAV